MLQYISFDLKSIGYLGGKNYHLLSMLTARKYEDMHESQIVLLLCSSYMHHCGGSFFMFSYAGPWGHLTRSIHAIQGRDCHAWSPQRVPFEGEAAKACYCEGLYWLWQTKRKLIGGGQTCCFVNLMKRPSGTDRQETSPFELHFSVHNITWWMCLISNETGHLSMVLPGSTSLKFCCYL